MWQQLVTVCVLMCVNVATACDSVCVDLCECGNSLCLGLGPPFRAVPVVAVIVLFFCVSSKRPLRNTASDLLFGLVSHLVDCLIWLLHDYLLYRCA